MRIRKLVDSGNNKICFLEYSLDLFDGKTNKKLYKEIITHILTVINNVIIINSVIRINSVIKINSV